MPREYRGVVRERHEKRARPVAVDRRSRTIRSMEGRDLAVLLARGRIAIGVVSLLAPGLVGRAITGRDGSAGGTRLFARMVGARDLGLGLGVLVALERGAPCAAGSKRPPPSTESTRPRACSRATTSAPACYRVSLAWPPRERCSAPGWHVSSTRRSVHRDSRGGGDGRSTAPEKTGTGRNPSRTSSSPEPAPASASRPRSPSAGRATGSARRCGTRRGRPSSPASPPREAPADHRVRHGCGRRRIGGRRDPPCRPGRWSDRRAGQQRRHRSGRVSIEELPLAEFRARDGDELFRRDPLRPGRAARDGTTAQRLHHQRGLDRRARRLRAAGAVHRIEVRAGGPERGRWRRRSRGSTSGSRSSSPASSTRRWPGASAPPRRPPPILRIAGWPPCSPRC